MCSTAREPGVATPGLGELTAPVTMTFQTRRMLAILLLLVAFGCHAEGTSDITNRLTEIDRDKDGKIDVRIETVYRGKTKAMMTISQRNAQGVMLPVARSYFVGGHLTMTESDEDKDGVLETIALHNADTDELEVFTRQPDGSVKPVSKQTLDAYKQQFGAVTDFFGEAFDKGFDEERLPEKVRQVQQKIQDAEKKKLNDKK